MKKTLFGLSLVLLLAGCGGVEEGTQAETAETKKSDYKPTAWTDTKTGCEYLIIQTGRFEGGVFMTPRLQSDGNQICQGGF